MTSLKKQLSGVVVRKSGDKTVSVEVIRHARHPKYGKRMVASRRFIVHDEGNKVVVGENVTIEECRPISKMKRWTIIKSK